LNIYKSNNVFIFCNNLRYPAKKYNSTNNLLKNIESDNKDNK